MHEREDHSKTTGCVCLVRGATGGGNPRHHHRFFAVTVAQRVNEYISIGAG